MSDLNINHNQKEEVLQPQLARKHHAYRSPMSSEDFNLEVNQFRYDLACLYKAFLNLSKTLEEKIAFLYAETSTLTGSTSIKVDQAVPTELSFIINSLDTIGSKLEKIRNRIYILEKGL